jgi:hypothetical protein
VVLRAVTREHVEAEVAGEVAPHRVHVLCPGLRVVELDQEARPLDPVVDGPARPGLPRPGEVDGVPSLALDLGASRRRDGWGEIRQVEVDQPVELRLLRPLERGACDARGLPLESDAPLAAHEEPALRPEGQGGPPPLLRVEA